MHSATCPLNMALSIFKENLPDIREAVTQNMLHNLSLIPLVEFTPDEDLLWVRQAVRDEKIRIASEDALNTIRRIDAALNYTVPKPGGVTDEHITRAKEFPIEEMFEGKLFKSGSGLVGRCPFHNNGKERTPSFHIKSTNHFRCFGCQVFGDSIDFVKLRDGVDFIRAVKKLNNI